VIVVSSCRSAHHELAGPSYPDRCQNLSAGRPPLCHGATDNGRRALIDELLDGVEDHSDHLEVIVRGAPRLNVTLEEVGL